MRSARRVGNRPLFGVDRTWWTRGQNGAIDQSGPYATADLGPMLLSLLPSRRRLTGRP